MSRPPVVALLPLDDRPATGRHAAMVGAVAGARVVLPPAELLPRLRTPGDRDGLARWLLDSRADLAVVSLEMLGLGGLVPSRIGHEPAADALVRWDLLRSLTVPVHASCVVLRTPDADDATEEPDYYAGHGRAIHAASAALASGAPVPAGTDSGALGDFLARRLRNHVLNLAAVGLVLDGTVRTLAVGADDTAVAAVGTAEQRWVASWRDWLGVDDRVLTYPGADEVGAVLVLRALGAHLGGPVPTVSVHAVDDSGPAPSLDRVAPYENVPVRRTAVGQLRAAGARETTSGSPADLALVIHPPATNATGGDFAVAPPAGTDTRTARATAELVGRLLARGSRVTVADCAYPNGADPALVDALHDVLGGEWDRLAGFAGWNTAGNSLGSALAHGLAVVLGEREGTFDAEAHATLLRQRLLEDWGWMSRARAVVRAELGSDPRRHDHVPSGGHAERLARRELDRLLAGVTDGWRVDDVTFPWGRTFEVDLSVARA